MDLLNSNVPSTLAVAALIFLVFGPVPLLITDMFSIDINTSWNSRRQKARLGIGINCKVLSLLWLWWSLQESEDLIELVRPVIQMEYGDRFNAKAIGSRSWI